jgi:hypothetical protein
MPASSFEGACLPISNIACLKVEEVSDEATNVNLPLMISMTGLSKVEAYIDVDDDY